MTFILNSARLLPPVSSANKFVGGLVSPSTTLTVLHHRVSLVDDYLSTAHRDHPGTGCPVGALAGDFARSGKQTRAIVTRQIREDIELVATLIRGTSEKNKRGARSQAILTYCVLVGAIGVARAVSDEQLSRKILKTLAVV